jgi:chromosome segregation ATPase
MDQERLNELKACYHDASNSSKRRVERLKDEYVEASAHDRVMDAVGDLFSEIDDLKDKVERQQAEIDDLEQQLDAKQTECDDLRQRLLESENKQLEQERQHLEAEVKAKPTEIHNHFGAGSSSQVFNDKVTGKFPNKKEKKDKKEKKRWKKIARRIL